MAATCAISQCGRSATHPQHVDLCNGGSVLQCFHVAMDYGGFDAERLEWDREFRDRGRPERV
jgi:hypothetical protein